MLGRFGWLDLVLPTGPAEEVQIVTFVEWLKATLLAFVDAADINWLVLNCPDDTTECSSDCSNCWRLAIERAEEKFGKE